MKPTHQKARFLPGHAHIPAGAEVWLELGSPTPWIADDLWGGPIRRKAAYLSCLKREEDGTLVGVPEHQIELLPEFAENPTPILWTDWLTSERTRLAAERGGEQ